MRILIISILLLLCPLARGQSTATLQGRVVDPASAVVVRAEIKVLNRATGLEWNVLTDRQGNYQIAALPAGTYRVEIQAPGFQPQIIENLSVEVAQTIVKDFRLSVGSINQTIIVNA